MAIDCQVVVEAIFGFYSPDSWDNVGCRMTVRHSENVDNPDTDTRHIRVLQFDT